MSVNLDKLNCYIDLHLHLDGSLSIESARELARMQNISLPANDDELRKLLTVGDECKDLNDYLNKFDLPMELMQTYEAIAYSFDKLERELAEQGLIYAEIRYAPQKHCLKGLTQEEAILAAIEGNARNDFYSGIILCCMRGDDNKEENFETIRLAKKYMDRGVVAVDLAGAEGMFKTEMFEELFAFARECGVPFTIHAGEADGPDSVWNAIKFGAKRIGHGIRSHEDPELLAYIRDNSIPIERCYTSNIQTLGADYVNASIKKEDEYNGLNYVICTDNMAVSNTSMPEEFRRLREAFKLEDEDIKTLMENAEGDSGRGSFEGWI